MWTRGADGLRFLHDCVQVGQPSLEVVKSRLAGEVVYFLPKTLLNDTVTGEHPDRVAQCQRCGFHARHSNVNIDQ